MSPRPDTALTGWLDRVVPRDVPPDVVARVAAVLRPGLPRKGVDDA